MAKELFTIPEFAEVVGIKKQGIYEQVKNSNSKLFPYVVLKGKKAYIKFEALEKVYGITVKQEQETQGENQDSQGESQDSQEQKQEGQAGKQDKQGESQEPRQEKQGASQGTEREIIEFLQEQLRERDKQINGLLQMLAYEQQAHQKTLLQLEEARGNTTAEAEAQEQEPIEEDNRQEEAPAEEQKDLSWWQKFVNWWRM